MISRYGADGVDSIARYTSSFLFFLPPALPKKGEQKKKEKKERKYLMSIVLCNCHQSRVGIV